MRPKTTPEIKKAIVLRQAGFTLASIAERTDTSVSSLQRIFKKYRVERGELSSNAIEQAREQLLRDGGFIGELKHAIASSIVDDLALVRRLRESLLLTLEELNSDKSTPTSIKARSLAALSTSLSVTQAVSRKALNADTNSQALETPTVLTIRRMTGEDIEEIQRRLRSDEDNIDD